MVTVGEINQKINVLAPPETAMDFDNVGLLVGDKNMAVTVVLLALDVTRDVVMQASEMGAQLIISHHPVIFNPLKRLSSDSVPYLLAQKGISVISAHTNYDLAPEGVNYCLAKTLGLQEIKPFAVDKRSGLAEGLLGILPNPLSPDAFAAYVKEKLHCGGISYTRGKCLVQKVAVGCGAGSYLLFDALESGADGFVTGESKHHELLAAREANITMVTAGHFNTENIAMQPLADKLKHAFPNIIFQIAEQSDPVSYL